MFVATLIKRGALGKGDVDMAIDQMADAGQSVRGWTWIDEGDAADIMFDGAVDVARAALALDGGDVIVQGAAGRRKTLLVADMDSTMITVECIDELADYAGLKPEIAAITERAMQGELDFAAALDARVALLAGMPETTIADCLAERVTIMPGAKALVRTLRAKGGTAVLVSGGFMPFAQPVAAAIGFDRAYANRLVIADGVLTGAVERPIVDSATKEAVLREWMVRLDLAASDVLAVGDGANDIPMLRAAGLGVAYHAKPAAQAAADAAINHNDLSAILYGMGMARADWVEG